MKALDYMAVLENAGADPHAAEGSQAWALAQVAGAMRRLHNDAAGAYAHLLQDTAEPDATQHGVDPRHHAIAVRFRASIEALAGGLDGIG